jgi:cbb3-type cytochrome oxidase maturation protein
MYYFLYIVYVILSSAVFLLFFFWGLKHGQFKDQQRARFLPLVEDRDQKVSTRMGSSGSSRSHSYFFFGLLFTGAAAVGVVVIYMIIH